MGEQPEGAGWSALEGRDNVVLGYEHEAEAYMDSQSKKSDSMGTLTTITGLTLVFAIQYLIDYESDVFKDHNSGLKAYLFFMSFSAGISGVGLWVCVAFMAFNAMLQAEYMERGTISQKQFEAYKTFMSETFIYRMIAVFCTCASLGSMIVGTFIYIAYKLDAADLDWDFISIPIVITSFFTLLACIVSGMVFCSYLSASGHDEEGNKKA